MKTITLKANPDFDKELTELAKRLQTTKSAVIREAVGEYKTKLDREEMRKRLAEVSERLRDQTREIVEELDGTVGDGLDDV